MKTPLGLKAEAGRQSRHAHPIPAGIAALCFSPVHGAFREAVVGPPLHGGFAGRAPNVFSQARSRAFSL
jgi:hypothetical protein